MSATEQRECCVCDWFHVKTAFSKNQWSKGDGRSRCKLCLSGESSSSSRKRRYSNDKQPLPAGEETNTHTHVTRRDCKIGPVGDDAIPRNDRELDHQTRWRDCITCRRLLPVEKYHKKQWRNGTGDRQCKECLHDGKCCIFVQTLNMGRNVTPRITLSVDLRCDTVDSIKAQIRDSEGIPTYVQRLVLAGWRLEDGHATLRECRIGKGFTLHLLPRETSASQVRYNFPFHKRIIADDDTVPQRHFPRHFEENLAPREVEGIYDIIFLSVDDTSYFHTPLDVVLNGTVTIGLREDDRVAGVLSADSLESSDYASSSSRLKIPFNQDFPVDPSFPMSQRFPGDGIDVHPEVCPQGYGCGGRSSPTEAYDSTGFGALFVYSTRAAIPREDIGDEGLDGGPGDGEANELMERYLSPGGSGSWLHNHLSLPIDVVSRIVEFWRTEPPPQLLFEVGDLMLGFSWGERAHTFSASDSDSDSEEDVLELFCVARPRA